MASDKIDIIARISDKALGNTTDLKNSTVNSMSSIPKNAFLIVNGWDIFPLDQAVINIGRRSTNHLAIDDPRVSRQHAQIRATQGRYKIFDLDSTGGTFINKKQVKQSLLRPGDVISLAGVHLIYGQERSSSLKNTKKFLPNDNPDQPD
jgi:pSer/pThr/pTyr-binding forkhead associated (FHA) protein